MSSIEQDKQSYRLVGAQGQLIYLPEKGAKLVKLPAGKYALKQVDMRTGTVSLQQEQVVVKRTLKLEGGALYWLQKL